MGNRHTLTNGDIQARIRKGWQPNRYLSNMSMAYFAKPGDWVAPVMFPVCPVTLSTSYYYTFLKGDWPGTMYRENRRMAKSTPQSWATRIILINAK